MSGETWALNWTTHTHLSVGRPNETFHSLSDGEPHHQPYRTGATDGSGSAVQCPTTATHALINAYLFCIKPAPWKLDVGFFFGRRLTRGGREKNRPGQLPRRSGGLPLQDRARPHIISLTIGRPWSNSLRLEGVFVAPVCPCLRITK